MKLTSSGNLDWQKSLGGSADDWAYDVHQTTDGGYIVGGYTMSNDYDVTGSHGSSDYWVVKLTSSGNLDWQKSLGGSNIDDAFSIKQTSDGGYIVAGYTLSTDGDVTLMQGVWDFWITKLDSLGNLKWQKSLGGSSDDVAYSVFQTNDYGYIVAGESGSTDGDVTGNHGNPDYWLTKLDSSGNLIWQKSLGGSDYDNAFSIKQTCDGGYIVAGSSKSINGDVTVNHGNNDYWVVKLNPLVGINETMETLGISVFPNPVNDKLYFRTFQKSEIEILNIDGQIIKKIKAKDNKTELNVSDFSSGVYIIRATTNVGITTNKFIKQ